MRILLMTRQGQPTRGEPLVWELSAELTTLHCKMLCHETFTKVSELDSLFKRRR